MGNAAVSCCMSRDAEEDGGRLERCESWHSIPDCEEQWLFFEEFSMKEAEREDDEGDSETFASCSSIAAPVQKVPSNKVKSSRLGPVVEKKGSWYRLRANSRPLALVPEDQPSLNGLRGEGGSSPVGTTASGDDFSQYLPFVPQVAAGVRQHWRKQIADNALDDDLKLLISEGFPELDEWTRSATVVRMLKAVQNDLKHTHQMLVKAVESRVRDRALYSTLLCEVNCDIRVIGRDKERRPTVYMCARSQRGPLKDIRAQFFLAFEAAVRLCQNQDFGQVLLVADMHKFSASLNMDPFLLKEICTSFGNIFAERFAFVLVVDFSFVAQSVWSLCKPMISEKTQKKINFVSESKAREIVHERFHSLTANRITSSFDINRSWTSTDAEREAHARRTAICDVPLGTVRSTDVAG